MSRNLVQLRRHRGDHAPLDVTETALQRLKHVMHDKRVLREEDIAAVAKATGQPEAAVFGVATYYGDLGVVPRGRTRVKVCKGAACHAACGGTDASMTWFEDALGLDEGQTSEDGEVSVEGVYCLGFCQAGPAVEIEGHVYAALDAEKVHALAKDLPAAAKGATAIPVADEAHVPPFVVSGGPAIVLERLAHGAATSLEIAREHHVFEGLARALTALDPDKVLAEVEASQLRGRGGAGFSTATKWRLCATHARTADQAFVVCNADEGDPGSFIDKWILERDPFALIEGMALAGFAIGASRGVVYIRSEYPRSLPILRRAVEEARAEGLLGKNILGSSFTFDIDVIEGAGSYVCGEETALLRSAEGLRGMVTARPPYPAEKGLFGKPTIVNNVETLANVGWIVRYGGAAYASHGVGKSRGTKTICLNERFVRPGIYEVPLGTSLRHVLETLGGGMKDGRRIKAVQVGGPLGGILPASLLDVPLGFEELDAVGALLGHGGVVAWDDRVDAREIADHLFTFCDDESCGKCFPCRIGGRRGVEIARRLKTPRPRADVERDLALLSELLETLKLGSLCAHGGAIPDPIRSLLRHFPAEMAAGVRDTDLTTGGAV